MRQRDEGLGCPGCAGPLSREPWAAGLCLSCLAGLALLDSPVAAAAEAEDLPTEDHPGEAFAPGRILGGRYRVRSLLGRGGMGEVWRALDLKLRVDVALKALRAKLHAEPRALETLRQEVRAARVVVSPNVCRIFDLVELEGRELVSMEYVDGLTLAGVLASRSPLTPDEAREIAAQLLAGLEAIHAAGLVHRDIKPENVMLTRAGRLVVMDFGLAKALVSDRTGTVAGTAAYMAPEQARGESLDARADVFSAGIVLAELLAPAGTRERQAREAIWAGVHRSPPDVADTPWAQVLRKAVAPRKEDRYPSAAALARALEEVTLRVAGAELLEPYPGLASFGAENAEYFFGRELEIEAMWRKLRRPHLLALVGPSGAGKSSFLRAGLLATAPAGWQSVIATPGDRPWKALAQALIPELAGDQDGLELLLRIEEPDAAVAVFERWRRRHDQALVVLDQFEELFTQNPPAVQANFAALVGRLALDADVHVLLALRDDFLFHCHAHEPLQPILSDLTLLGPPTGAALRRALVQPALRCGYRFEDEALVDAMLAEVESERGALPLVAFAAAQLWQRRERERGVLTHEAYAAIGGVGGALAQHAEATLERIGHERVAIVRELFRNLVTAEKTRATVDRDELLSVFAGESAGGSREAAAQVLDGLVDARLLTSYELPAAEGENAGHHRIEIIHESLLSKWPRLVRWLAQDQEGALLRDQLRQVARLWQERGRPEDLLWTGTSFREYELWRERYAGQLTAGESAFAQAMTARTLRRRRQQRLGIAAVITAAITVAAAMGLLWRKSEAARAQAVASARRTEAQQLFALGQLELEKNPTAALAYALTSLERADSPGVRRFALRALWRGPTAFVLASTDQAWGRDRIDLSFSPDGEWLAGISMTGATRFWKSDGSARREIPAASGSRAFFAFLDFSADSKFLVITQSDSIRIHSLPAGNETRRIAGSFRWGVVRGKSVITGAFLEPTADGRPRRLVQSWPLDGTPETTLGIWTSRPGQPGGFYIDEPGRWYYGVSGGSLFRSPAEELARVRWQLIVRGDDPIGGFFVSPDSARIYTLGQSGVLRVWSGATGAPLPGSRQVRRSSAAKPYTAVGFSADGRWLAMNYEEKQEEAVAVWNLTAAVEVEPVVLRSDSRLLGIAVDPRGSWVAAHDQRAVSLWPLTERHPQVLRGRTPRLRDLAIDPRGRWIAAGGDQAANVSIWSLAGDPDTPRTLDTGAGVIGLEASPRGDFLAAGTGSGLWLIPFDGRRPERLPGFKGLVRTVAFDPAGRRLAAGGGFSEQQHPGEAVIRIWNLDTREAQVLDAGDGKPIVEVVFLPDGRLLSTEPACLRLWDLETGTNERLLEGAVRALPSPDGRYLLGIRGAMRPGGAVGTGFVYDLQQKRSSDLATHGTELMGIGWHPSGRHVVTGSRDGIVRVGEATGEEPHLLFGHEGAVLNLEVEPGGRFVASTGEDGTVRMWPMPEGQPFHTLSHGELVERLRSLTNQRVVEDAASPSGYRLDFEPFGGWKRKLPTW